MVCNVRLVALHFNIVAADNANRESKSSLISQSFQSMLPMPRILGYIILLIVASIGSMIGVFTGFLIKGRKLRPTLAIVAALAGAAGSILGMYVSQIDASLEERFVDGRLVYRHVTGFADYMLIFAAAGAVIVPLLITLCVDLARKLIARRDPNLKTIP